MGRDADLAGRTVLLLEDEAIVAMDLELALQDAGAAVHLAMNLAEAEVIRDAQPIDGAVLDMCLPDGTSIDLARRLAEDGVVLVFHSGDADLAHVSDEFPAAGIVRKPSASELVVRELSVRSEPAALAAE